MALPSMTTSLTIMGERLNDASNRQFSTTVLERYINEGCRDISLKAEWKRLGPTNVAFLAAATTGVAPTTMIRLESAEYQITGQSAIYPLEIREWNEMSNVWGTSRGIDQQIPGWVTARGYPGAWTLYLYPIPASAGNLIINYTALSTDVTGASLLDAPEGWQQMVFDYAEYKCLRRLRDPRWQEAKQAYEENLNYMIGLVRTFHNQPSVNTFGLDDMLYGEFLGGAY